MRTVYLGTSTFAVDVLGALATSPHRPQLVVTPPDRPQGTGPQGRPRRRSRSPRATSASSCTRPRPSTTTARSARIEQAAPEAICVCQFGQLIKEPLLSRFLMLNVHPSVLPRWRGAAPIERALMAGDAVTGVTIFQITAGLDSGPIALARARADPSRRHRRHARRAARAARRRSSWSRRSTATRRESLELTEQPEEGVTYADKIDPGERRLDPRRPAVELERIVRALTPAIGAYLELEGGERLGVEAARVVDGRPCAGRAVERPTAACCSAAARVRSSWSG